MKPDGFLILESGEVFPGLWRGGMPSAGEVVFNTSHSGYEEMATDPSYFSQILVATAPMQGNYGEDNEVWESDQIWIKGFVCLELQETSRESGWLDKLDKFEVPILSHVNTRKLVMHLRSQGVSWGALVRAKNLQEAKTLGQQLIMEKKSLDPDWTYSVSCKEPHDISTEKKNGLRVAVLDFGCKKNTLRELARRFEFVRVFPARTSAQELREWGPHGLMLSNGPGDPAEVRHGAQTVKELLGEVFIFGICMGHQVLAHALGAETYKLKFGHRGSNHPIRDELLNKIYMTSQNHGYAVKEESLPKGVRITHKNLNDDTISGIYWPEKKCFSVQFHPESHPGPHDASELFDFFGQQIK